MITQHQQKIIDTITNSTAFNLIHDHQFDELSFIVAPQHVADLLIFLRDDPDLMFKQLIDICGVDYLGRTPRYDVVYHLLSLQFNQRIRIKIFIDDNEPIPTVTNLFNAANWYEREIFDLFGLTFKDHPNLYRILTDYNFQGYPLRKDFPLTGYVEPIYDAEQKRVVYNPVVLPQEFRDFDFLSPWAGMTPDQSLVLPGDEKANQTNVSSISGV